MRPGDPDWDPPDPEPPRRALYCVCGGDTVGPCPGPLNCPYSGCEPEEENKMTYEELHRALMEFFGDTDRTASETKEGLLDLIDAAQSLVESIDEGEEE